jgi:hypothetical protein
MRCRRSISRTATGWSGSFGLSFGGRPPSVP